MTRQSNWQRISVFCDRGRFENLILDVLCPACDFMRVSGCVDKYFLFLSEERGEHVVIAFLPLKDHSIFFDKIKEVSTDFFINVKGGKKRRNYRQLVNKGVFFRDFPRYGLRYTANIDACFDYIETLSPLKHEYLFQLQMRLIKSGAYLALALDDRFVQALEILWTLFPKNVRWKYFDPSSPNLEHLNRDFLAHKTNLIEYFGSFEIKSTLVDDALDVHFLLGEMANPYLVARFVSDLFGIKYVSHLLFFFKHLFDQVSFKDLQRPIEI